MLIITHSCNLNCTYCYEDHKDSKTMSFETAKKTILNEVEIVKQSDEFSELEVDFMGGEPFMNYELIQEIVEWMEFADFGVPFVTACATNGTLVTSEKYKWLIQHRKTFVPGLSYDGNGEMQAQNRTKNSVDVDFFISTWPEQEIHVTISKESLPFLANGVLELQRKGALVNVALAQGVSWSDRDAMVYKRELQNLSDAYLCDDTVKPISLLTRPLFNIGRYDGVPRKYCGTGKGMVTYDVDGKCYPCHLFSPVVVGQRAAQISDMNVCCDKAITDPYCSKCVYMNWCPTCYGFNFRDRGETWRRDHSWCSMVNVQARASCVFQLKYYHAHLKMLSKSADGFQIGAALDVYKMLVLRRTTWKKMDMEKVESFECEYQSYLKRCVESGRREQLIKWLGEVAKDEDLYIHVLEKLEMLSGNESGWPGATMQLEILKQNYDRNSRV